ncbi:ATP-binding protein [Streptomyces mexicanus]|uniref:ATP-binding protein n=1 Tax=Streptomyces mexicanus TaxID=178566 RepID=UPI0036CD49F8
MSREHSFGAVLRGLRQRAGLTMEELAEASGVSVRAISDMERGRSRVPQRRTVAALVEGLDPTDADREALLTAARAARPMARATAAGTAVPPRSVGDFTGRERELAWLRRAGERARLDEGTPVAVVSGPPGCGKTTLALKAASELAPGFPDGCFVVDLHGVDGPVDPGEALLRLLVDLGVSERRLGQRDAAGRAALLRTLLAERRCLVVLDNARDEAQLRPLLPAGGSSLVLVTSRSPLSGLEAVDRLALAELPRPDAVELLRRILGEKRADAETDAVARVAQLCGHLPLALRVAGNWLAVRSAWSVEHLAGRLTGEERRLAALAAGDVRVEAAFELSYRQLTDHASRMLRLLSLVPGPDFTAAHGAALAAVDVFDAEDVIGELVEAGLLRAAYTGRYQLHDLLRLFARARLAEEEPGEGAAAEERLVSWLLATAAAAGRWFTPRDDVPSPSRQGLVPLENREQARAWLESEAPAWIAALRTAAARGEHTRVVETVHALDGCATLIAHRANWLEIYLLSSQAAAALGDPRLQAVHLTHCAWALTDQAWRHREAIERAEEALEHARRAQDPALQAWALRWAAWAHRQLHEFHASADKALAATDLFEAAGDHAGWLAAVSTYGTALRGLGRAEEAVVQRRRIIAFLDAPDCPVSAFRADMERAKTTTLTGQDYMALGRWREAVDHLRSGSAQLRRIGFPSFESVALAGLGEALIELGEIEEARSCLRQALAFGDEAYGSTLKTARKLLDQLPAE